MIIGNSPLWQLERLKKMDGEFHDSSSEKFGEVACNHGE